MAKKSKKTFEMNDDYGDLDALEPLGLDAVDQLIYTEKPEPKEAPPEDSPPVPEAESLEGQVDQVARELSGAKSGGQVYLVNVGQLEPYPDQPFKQYPPDRLAELAEDIGRVGVLSPILTRRKGSRLQILAGHNRWAAAKLAGLTEVPVMVLEADDDRAILVLTSTNLRQREKLLPSEKAFAYKMQMDALKRQGQRTPGGYDASSFITRQTGDSRMQIHRYVRLCELLPGLLELLDKGRISLTPAVAVSHLHPESQDYLLSVMRQYGVSLTIERAGKLKALAGETPEARIEEGAIEDTMLQTGKQSGSAGGFVRLRSERIRDFFPPDASVEEMEERIVAALEALEKK